METQFNRLVWIRARFYALFGKDVKNPITDRIPHVHISDRNSKLGDIPNFSLTPGTSCSAAACRTCLKGGCYACKSYRMYSNVRDAWDDNTFMALYHPRKLEKELSDYFGRPTAPRFFRIHVAGDFINRRYAKLWARVAAAAPDTKFLAFTKQFDVIRGVKFPNNFTVILSDWPGIEIPDDLKKVYHVAWLNDGTRSMETFPADCLECPGHCETCGACWDLKRDTMFHKH